MNRRSILTISGLTFFSIAAGCSSHGNSNRQCQLMHEVVESADDYGEPTETYRYEELSSEAQTVFEAAADNGSYSTTNQDLESSEFRYWDTMTIYNITYQNETYVLLTYTGAGCETE